MLNRNDLTKQFELVVQQEIKNHNDAIAATNSSLEEFRRALISLGEKFARFEGKYDSDTKKNEIEFDSLSITYDSLMHRVESYMNDIRSFNERSINEIKLILVKLEDSLKENQLLEGRLNRLEEEQNNIKDILKSKEAVIVDALDDNKRKFTRDMQKMKEEILSMPSEAQAVKRLLEEKIAASAIDFAGVQREIDISKRNVFISEKKIENLYTLIERLKGNHEPSGNS